MIDVFAASLSSSEFLAAERREAEWCALMAEKIAGYRRHVLTSHVNGPQP
jgi:hypothetical protein